MLMLAAMGFLAILAALIVVMGFRIILGWILPQRIVAQIDAAARRIMGIFWQIIVVLIAAYIAYLAYYVYISMH